MRLSARSGAGRVSQRTSPFRGEGGKLCNRRRRDSARGDRDGRVLSEAGTRWSAMARPGVDLAALERAQLFGSDIPGAHTRAAERFRATGDRTGELPGLA